MSERILSVKNSKNNWNEIIQSVISFLKDIVHSAIIESCKEQSYVEIRLLYLKKKSQIKIHTNSESKRSFTINKNSVITEDINKKIKLTEVEIESRVVTIINALTPIIKEMFLCEYRVDKRSLIDSEISFFIKKGEMSSIKEISYRFSQTCKFPPPKKEI